MEIKIPASIKVDEKSILNQLQNAADRAVRLIVNSQFDTGRLGPPKGPAYAKVEQTVEALIASSEEATTQYITKYFEDNWQRILEESLQKALQHKANALAFKAASKKLPLNFNNPEQS